MLFAIVLIVIFFISSYIELVLKLDRLPSNKYIKFLLQASTEFNDELAKDLTTLAHLYTKRRISTEKVKEFVKWMEKNEFTIEDLQTQLNIILNK